VLAIKNALAVTAACVALALVLGACSSASGTSLAGERSAKQATLKLESQIVGFVPADQVISTQQTKSSKVIFPCLDKPGHSSWPGSTRVNLKSDVKSAEILIALAANWSGKKGWSVYQNKDASGNATLILKSSNKASYTVAFVAGPQMIVTAHSSCFADAGLDGMSSY
jgi:hypothetical protein